MTLTPDTDFPALVVMRVPCHNSKDGCRSVVEYEGEEGSKPLKKICARCQGHGAPLERVGVSGPQVRKSNPKIPKHFMQYGSDMLYEITAYPMAPFYSHGRVSRAIEG
jgi:hypothetical protein